MAASHRSLIQDQISDVTECSICAEIFTNPKILPCVHTFCLRCLETYGKEKNPGEQMICPICRREFPIPVGGFSNLPSNFFIGKLVEIAKQSMTPDIKSPCALCPDEDAVLAQLFCVDCEQHLCSRCGSIHKKSKCSKSHHMVELGSQLNAKELNLRTSYCGHHPEEQIKMYCYEDKVAICLICCVESHQSHRCVNANKAAGEFTEELKRRSGKVASRTAECEELVVKLEKFKKEFQTKVLKTEEGIREAANKTTKLIQQHTEQLVQRLKSVAERNIKAFETTRQDVDRFRVMIDSYSRYTEKLLTQGSPVDVCRAVDQMLTRAQELETLPTNCSGDRFCCDTIAFNPLDIERQLTNAIGELIVTPSSDWLLQFGVQDRKKSTIRPTVKGVKTLVDETEVLQLVYKEGSTQERHRGSTSQSSIRYPKHWSFFKSGQQTVGKMFHTRTEITPGGVGIFEEVSRLVMNTWEQQKVGHGSDSAGLGPHKIKIRRIFCIENPSMYRTYMAQREEFCLKASVNKYHRVNGLQGEREIMTFKLGLKQLDAALASDVNECYLLHGTERDIVHSIERTGLDSRLSGQTVLFGPGTYFTESSTKADQYADSKTKRIPNGQPLYMYVCRVLLGRTFICQTPKPFKRPPCMQTGCYSDICASSNHPFVGTFDSVIGTHKGSLLVRLLFREFVIYHPDQSYPEFLVEYERQ